MRVSLRETHKGKHISAKRKAKWTDLYLEVIGDSFQESRDPLAQPPPSFGNPAIRIFP